MTYKYFYRFRFLHWDKSSKTEVTGSVIEQFRNTRFDKRLYNILKYQAFDDIKAFDCDWCRVIISVAIGEFEEDIHVPLDTYFVQDKLITMVSSIWFDSNRWFRNFHFTQFKDAPSGNPPTWVKSTCSFRKAPIHEPW